MKVPTCTRCIGRRKTRLRVLAFQVLIMLLPASLAAQDSLALSPEQLVGVIAKGQSIKLVLRSGTYAEARVVSARPSAIEIKVTKSDNLRDLPKGNQSLSLNRVATVQTETCAGSSRKALPLLLGGILAPSLGFAANLKEKWAVPAAAATTGGIALLAYWGGKASDCRTLTISLVGDGSAPGPEPSNAPKLESGNQLPIHAASSSEKEDPLWVEP